METLAQQVADLQDGAEGREDAHSERVAALQATIERLSGEAETRSEGRTAELEAKCAALEEQARCGRLASWSAARVFQQPPFKLQLRQPLCRRACRAGKQQRTERHATAMKGCWLRLQVADMDCANLELEDANTQLEASANAAEQRCADLEQEVHKLHTAQSTLKVAGPIRQHQWPLTMSNMSYTNPCVCIQHCCFTSTDCMPHQWSIATWVQSL